jgi:hypothetical protein
MQARDHGDARPHADSDTASPRGSISTRDSGNTKRLGGYNASARVLERQGFVMEGLLRERWIVGGKKSDSALYGLLARDFEARRSMQ